MSKIVLTKLLRRYTWNKNNKHKLRQKVRGSWRHLCVEKPLLTYTKNNFKMLVSPKDYLEYQIFFWGVYDPKMTQILEFHVKEGQTVWDVGAASGWFSLLMAELVGKDGRVDAFEAFPINFKKLTTNLNLNNYPQIRANQLGISDTNKKIWFEPPSDEIINHQKDLVNCSGIGYITSKPTHKTLEISATSFDIYAHENNIKQLDLIKIDIEGEEFKALIGGRQVIKEFRPIIVIEYNQKTARRVGKSIEELDSLIADLGYNRFEFGHKFVELDLKRWQKTPEDNCVFNVYCFPKNK